MLEKCPVGCVLVSHSPPWGAVDVNSSGQSLGSHAIRRAVETVQPRLVVCGHVHASGGKSTKIGNVTVINAGPAGFEFTLDAD